MIGEEDVRKGIQVLSEGFGPSNWSDLETGSEYTLPLEPSAMIRSLEIAKDTRPLPFSVAVGCFSSIEYPIPHCSKSPFSVIAAPKSRSSFMSRNKMPSKNGIRRGNFMNASSESGAITLPLFDPHA